MLEPLPHDLQAQTCACFRLKIVTASRPMSGIGDGHAQRGSRSLCGQMNLQRHRARLHAVLDRVFQDRVQQESRYPNVPRGGIEVYFGAKFFFESDFFESEIPFQDFNFLAQRHIGHFDTRERIAKKIGQLLDRIRRARGILSHQSVNGVERVKQKMRVDLAAQRFELGLMSKRAGAEGVALLSFQRLIGS